MNKLFLQFNQLFRNRSLYSVREKHFWYENRWLLLATVVTFVVAVFWRSWQHYVNPNLYFEDNSHYFNVFYGHMRDYSSLLYNPNGYLNIINNLIAKWFSYCDVRLQPYLYTYFSTGVVILTSVSLSFSGLYKNKYVIFIAPFLLGFSGLNHVFYYITLTYQIYVLVILLLTLLFWEPIKNNLLVFFQFLFLSLLIWSGPYSVLTVPVAGCFILFFRGKTKLMLALIVVTLLYTMTVNESTIWLQNILEPNIIKLWLHLLVSSVMLMDLAGSYDLQQLLIVSGCGALVLYLLRKDTFYLKMAFIFFALMNGALATYLLSKKIALYQQVLACHLVIAQFFWLALVLLTVDRFLLKSRAGQVWGAIACCIISTFIVYDNVQVPDKRKVPLMDGLSAFLEEIYNAEQLPLVEQNRQIDFQYGDKLLRPHVIVGVKNPNAETVKESVHRYNSK